LYYVACCHICKYTYSVKTTLYFYHLFVILPHAVHEQVYRNECSPSPSESWASVLQTFKMTALESNTFLTGIHWSLAINI
jgi:hypothetical protein